VTTDVENGVIFGEGKDIRKLIIDGALYLVKDSTIYDAQGKLVR
jgi:hypothetical protein